MKQIVSLQIANFRIEASYDVAQTSISALQSTPGISWPPVLRRQSFNLERLYPLIAQVLEQEQRIGMSVIGDLLEISAVSSYAGLVRNGVGRYSSPSEQSQGVSELAFWLSTFRQARKYLDRDVDHYREYQDSERVDEFLRTNECIIQLVNETRTRLQTKFPFRQYLSGSTGRPGRGG